MASGRELKSGAAKGSALSKSAGRASRVAPATGPSSDVGGTQRVGADHFRLGAERFIDNSMDRRLFEVTRSIVVAARSWRKHANEAIKPLSQTMARWETLYHVALADDAFTQRELARLMGVEGPTLVRMLDRLHKDGLIEREQSDIDQRVTLNRITPLGRKSVEQIMNLTNAARADILAGIDKQRLQICVEVLSEIIGRLDGKRQPPP